MEKSQIICIVTLSIYAVGVLFFLCGFGGPNWLEKGSVNLGLWKVCVGSNCDTIKLSDVPSWFEGTAALMIIAFLGVVASGVSFLWMPVTAVCHCVTGGLIMLAIIVFGASYEDSAYYKHLDLGWAFALSILAGLLFLANGIIMAVFAFQGGCDTTRRPIPCIGGSTGPA